MAIKKLSKKRSARTEARRSRRMSRIRGRVARRRMDNKSPVTPSRPARRQMARERADERTRLPLMAKAGIDPGELRLWG